MIPIFCGLTMTWIDILSTLENMAALPNNWDGEGAQPISSQTIDRTKDVLAWLIAIGGNPPCRVSPDLDGQVVLTWFNDGMKYQICVGDDCLLTFGFGSK